MVLNTKCTTLTAGVIYNYNVLGVLIGRDIMHRCLELELCHETGFMADRISYIYMPGEICGGEGISVSLNTTNFHQRVDFGC